ncbi:uncharacterized protein LOC107851354 isoform X2 [Capsicum annuum]|uniref:uncharacterized protein LOC107851354 isoform X2 n=1 Tax=Capsicum annuum TaxID=4072 RepID=UPI0007BF67AE|nr:uncharacterized protein LOC107851354 isoform X2 [Capsicum annuum]
MSTEEETLVEAALRVLNTADPVEKARIGDEVANKWLQGIISQPYNPSQELLVVPDRPARLTNDIIARFGKQQAMPRDFFTDFVKVAQDEGRHFTLLAARLKELGSFYGALPAHDGLWDSAIATSKDLSARLAIEHCVHEARGLDVMPTTISRFRNGGDNQTAELLENVVYPEEITHCAAGVKWFKYLCLRLRNPNLSDLPSEETTDVDNEVIQKFHSTVRTYFRGPLKPPFNEQARKAAGFGPQWYEPLAVKDFTAL